MTLRDIRPDKLFPDERLVQMDEAVIVFTPVSPYPLNEPYLTETEGHLLSSLGNKRRRDEGAAWRGVLRRLTGCGSTAYTSAGAPCIPGSGLHISVSHTTALAAVIVSENRCAIDIELKSRNFSRAASRYITPAESLAVSGYGDLGPGVVWCAKETLFKFSGQQHADLLKDIIITGTASAQNTIFGSIRTEGGIWREYPLHVITASEFLCVWMAPA